MNNNQDLTRMKTELASEHDDVEFELFAVQQGIAPERREALQLHSDAVSARMRTVDSMLESQARALAASTVPSVASMSKQQINAEFHALISGLG